MNLLWAFLLGAVFSFLGSIPPGTLNICVLQLGLQKKIKAALKFSLAVAIIEYPYTWIAVEFENWLTGSPLVIRNFQLLTAVVMTVLGIFTLFSIQKPIAFVQRFNESGFRRGLVLSILNPMAIPFWIGVTAYLKAQQWIDLSTSLLVHSFVFGTSVGVMVLLAAFTFLAARLAPYLQQSTAIKLLPGLTLLVLGLYAFVRYLISF